MSTRKSKLHEHRKKSYKGAFFRCDVLNDSLDLKKMRIQSFDKFNMSSEEHWSMIEELKKDMFIATLGSPLTEEFIGWMIAKSDQQTLYF